MISFSKYRNFSNRLPIFILTASAFSLVSFFGTKADAKTDSSAAKIQEEAYSYKNPVATNSTASVHDIQIEKAVLKKSSGNILEGSFILKNTANKDFLLKSITSDSCHSVGQFQDGQSMIENAEDASANIFKNLPIPHLNKIAFPFSSFHLSCIPKKNSFSDGEKVPFTFHYQQGDQTYHFTFQQNPENLK